MKTSDTIGKIAQSLLKAQRAITFAIKDAKNPQFKSLYADLSSVIDACKPALNESGIVFMQMPTHGEIGHLSLTTRLIHESGEWIESTATCPLQKNDPQGYGSAITYLRRYSLAAAVGLYQDDDDANAASKLKQDFRSSPTKGILEGLTASRQAVINDCADAMRERYAMDDVIGAYEIYIDFIDNEEKTALWGALQPDSKLRSAIKKYGESIKPIPMKVAA